MDEHRAQLSSVSSTLGELTQRVVAIADQHRDTDTHEVSANLDEVERALRSAKRKLERLVERLN